MMTELNINQLTKLDEPRSIERKLQLILEKLSKEELENTDIRERLIELENLFTRYIILLLLLLLRKLKKRPNLVDFFIIFANYMEVDYNFNINYDPSLIDRNLFTRNGRKHTAHCSSQISRRVKNRDR